MPDYTTTKILIIRNDKLGDFMLAWPCFALLKQSNPGTLITAIVPSYTRDMAEACPWIDAVITDHGNSLKGLLQLFRQIRQHKYSAVISLFSTGRIGLACWLARIPYRLAPATKLAQFFYNHRLIQRRSHSDKPEYAYNLDLILHYLSEIQESQDTTTVDNGTNDWFLSTLKRPLLSFPDKESIKDEFHRQFNIPANQKLVFIHPGSGGSANNLSTIQYAQLANKLISATGHHIVITAGPGETDIAHELSKKIGTDSAHSIFDSKKGLIDFSKHLQFAELFISGSTGPLHIAGALDVPTAAFYPRRRSATPLRWQTLNSPDKRLAFTPAAGAEESDMSRVDITAAAEVISQKFLR